jgi:hypothetical protein
MAVFVNAGNRRICSSPQSPVRADPASLYGRDRIFMDQLAGAPAKVGAARPEEASLHATFSAVWDQFEGDTCQDAVCARVLAFHLLMDRTQGRIVEEWLTPCLDSPEVVELDEAVVAAVGTAPLGENGTLLEGAFLSTVRAHVQQRSDAPTEVTASARRAEPICPTNRLAPLAPEDIAAHLLRHEARLAGVAESDITIAAKVCEKLRTSLSAMVGREAFRALVVRALALGARQHADLGTVRVTETGTLEGLCETSAQAARVLVSQLLTIPAILIGEVMTHSVLRKAWPGLVDWSFAAGPSATPSPFL